MEFNVKLNESTSFTVKFDFSKLEYSEKNLAPVAIVGLSYFARQIVLNLFHGDYSTFSKDKPLILRVTSARRSPEKNSRVGGVENSAHLSGLAIDLSCTNSILRKLLIASAVDAATPRIGIGKNYLHFDWDVEKPSCIWVY